MKQIKESEVKVLTNPNPSAKQFITHLEGGYNKYTNVRDSYESKYGKGTILPNCTGGAYGLTMLKFGIEQYEDIGLPKNHAKYWYTQADKNLWKQSKFPVNGAIACWDGKGNGHVAQVNNVKRDARGSAIGVSILESSYYGYDGKPFRDGPYKYNISTGVLTKSGYHFQGYLVPTWVDVEEARDSFAVGDLVEIVGYGNARKDGKGRRSGGIGWKRYIIGIYDAKYPYRLGNKAKVTTGYYQADSIKKIKEELR